MLKDAAAQMWELRKKIMYTYDSSRHSSLSDVGDAASTLTG